MENPMKYLINASITVGRKDIDNVTSTWMIWKTGTR